MEAIKLNNLNNGLKKRLMNLIPDSNLNLCYTCGMCSSGCPATGINNLDPRKFLRMVLLGLDEEVMRTSWIWTCTMCERCYRVCPMKVNISQMVYEIRASRPSSTLSFPFRDLIFDISY